MLVEGVNLNSAEWINGQMNLNRIMLHTAGRVHWLGELCNSIAAWIFRSIAVWQRQSIAVCLKTE